MKISVIVTAYNHEKYIVQCLTSVLNQQGGFQLEVIIGDDASTDHTRSIAEQFQAQYHGIVFLLPPEKNLGITKNLKRCLDACSGGYIAICEGDDYWTDTYKLKKQSEFLDQHADFSMCFSPFIILFEDTGVFELHSDPLYLKRDHITTEDLVEGNHIGNFSCCMYRTKAIRQLPQKLFEFFTVDWMFNMACGQLGQIGLLRDPMSVYRKHEHGAWSGQPTLENQKKILDYIDLYNEYFEYKYNALFMNKKTQLDNNIFRLQTSPNSEPLNTKQLMDWNRSLLIRLAEADKIMQSQLSRSDEGKKDNKATPVHWVLQFIRFLQRLPSRFLSISTHDKDLDPALNEVGILIVDDVFPHPLSAFRLQEFVSYLEEFENLKIYSSGLSIHLLGLQSLDELFSDFRKKHPEYVEKVSALRSNTIIQAKLIYIVFLGTVYQHIDIIEKAKVPFVFTLYPGGLFRINNAKSDMMLKRVTSSTCFRKVIVTQKITYDYLIEKQFCTPEQIEFIFGLVTPVEQMRTEYKGKSRFGFDKNILDICFSAHKYTEKGIEKGYDIFIDVARELCRKHDNIRFHVVGGFDENVIDVSEIRERITFYGRREMEWFDEFYKDKDIILSPNIPYLSTGAFDGFPTGSCVDAGLRKTALFCTDELKLNTHFVDGKEIVIIPHDATQVTGIIDDYYRNPQKLRVLAENGCQKIKELYSFNAQILPRINILKKELKRAQDGKKIVFKTMKNKVGYRQGMEQLIFSTLTAAKKVSPSWLKSIFKKVEQKIRSKHILFNFIKRLTPEFIVSTYLKLKRLL